ncbi:MAG: hypothetical protein R6X15_01545 [Pseudomonadota bacterium]
MSEMVEKVIEELGFDLTEWLGDNLQDALILGDCEDGVVAADVVFRDPLTGKLIYKSAPDSLTDLVYSLWEEWPEGDEKWRAMEYVLQQGEFELNLIYADEYDEDAYDSDIREQAVKKYFGNEPVDESNPD